MSSQKYGMMRAKTEPYTYRTDAAQSGLVTAEVGRGVEPCQRRQSSNNGSGRSGLMVIPEYRRHAGIALPIPSLTKA